MSDSKPSNINAKDAQATSRLDLSLVPMSAVAYEAVAMVEGDQKYGGYNYREAGVQASIYIAAALRHIHRWFNVEDEDPKTLVHHLGSARACLGIIIDGIEQGNLNDDRPPRQKPGLLEQLEAKVAHLQKIFPRRTDRYRGDREGRGRVEALGRIAHDLVASFPDSGGSSDLPGVRPTSGGPVPGTVPSPGRYGRPGKY